MPKKMILQIVIEGKRRRQSQQAHVMKPQILIRGLKGFKLQTKLMTQHRKNPVTVQFIRVTHEQPKLYDKEF